MSDSSTLPPVRLHVRSGACAGRARHPAALPCRPPRPLGRPGHPGRSRRRTRRGATAGRRRGTRPRGRGRRRLASEAWRVAVDTGLVDVMDEEEGHGRQGRRTGTGHLRCAGRRTGPVARSPGHGARRRQRARPRRPHDGRGRGRRDRLLRPGLGPGRGGRLPRRRARQPLPADRQRGRTRRQPRAAARARRLDDRAGRHGGAHRTTSWSRCRT